MKRNRVEKEWNDINDILPPRKSENEDISSYVVVKIKGTSSYCPVAVYNWSDDSWIALSTHNRVNGVVTHWRLCD